MVQALKGVIIGRHRFEVQVRGGNRGFPGFFPAPGNGAKVNLEKTRPAAPVHQVMTGANGRVVLYSPRIYYCRGWRCHYKPGNIRMGIFLKSRPPFPMFRPNL